MMLPLLLLQLTLLANGKTYASAQDAPAPDPCLNSTRCLSFTFDRAGTPIPHYVIEVSAEGRGRYTTQTTSSEASTLRRITVTPPTLKLLFAPTAIVTSGRCETHLKHIANSGEKIFSITTEGRTSTCTFNFSDTESLNVAATALQSMSATLYLGDRLEHAHRFDRLGLDAEMDALSAEAAAGRALEIQNIAATLQSIVDDERLMDRVRRKAARLLQEPAPPPAP